MIHGSIMGHIFINFIKLEHYYYVEMPHGPTKVKDGEEQIKSSCQPRWSYFWSISGIVKFPNLTFKAMSLHNLGCHNYC